METESLAIKETYPCSVCGKNTTECYSVGLSFFQQRVTSPWSYQTIKDNKQRTVPMCPSCKNAIETITKRNEKFKLLFTLWVSIPSFVILLIFGIVNNIPIGSTIIIAIFPIGPAILLSIIVDRLIHNKGKRVLNKYKEVISKNKNISPFVSKGYKIDL